VISSAHFYFFQNKDISLKCNDFAIGFAVISAVTMKSAMFSVMIPCSLMFTDVSHERTSSIFRFKE
jgi:hypothetical protein